MASDGTQKDYEAKVVINAAGVYADQIHNMVSDQKIEIEPRKGEYLLCDKSVGKMVSHTLFQLPTALGKGILVTPTVHGNLLIGPTAEDQENKEGVDTSSAGLDLVKEKGSLKREGSAASSGDYFFCRTARKTCEGNSA